VFPVADDYSNTAYRQLFTRRFQDERIFFVPGSAWHDSLPKGRSKPDNEVGSEPAFAKGLERGENHWAYVSGLNNGSPGNYPVIADGFTTTIGVYSDDEDDKGGVWEGDTAIFIRADGSGKLEKPGKGFHVYEVRDGNSIDIFSPAYFGDTSVKVLNPW